jgi:hypothetical protein
LLSHFRIIVHQVVSDEFLLDTLKGFEMIYRDLIGVLADLSLLPGKLNTIVEMGGTTSLISTAAGERLFDNQAVIDDNAHIGRLSLEATGAQSFLRLELGSPGASFDDWPQWGLSARKVQVHDEDELGSDVEGIDEDGWYDGGHNHHPWSERRARARTPSDYYDSDRFSYNSDLSM